MTFWIGFGVSAKRGEVFEVREQLVGVVGRYRGLQEIG